MCGVLLPDGGYNELLYSLVRLCHQIRRRTLLHDRNVLLERLSDNLLDANTDNRFTVLLGRTGFD